MCWGNGIEPETLREEPNVDQRRGLRTHDGNNADPALPENPEDGGDVDVDPVDNERQTNPSVHQRETSLDESLTWNNEDDTAQDSQDESPSETSNHESQTNTESDGEASSTSTKSSPTGSTTSSKQPDTNNSAPDSGDSDNESSDK